MKFHCCDPRRLDVLKRSGTANAIEFLEVLDRAAPPGAPRQQTLFVRLLRPGFTLTPDNLRIDGGERIRDVGIAWCAPADALPPQAEAGLVDTVDDLPRTLVVRTDSCGRLLDLHARDRRRPGSDDAAGRLRSEAVVDRRSRSRSNARPTSTAREPASVRRRSAHAPDIDYLAKDYQGFRRLMLDRLSLLVPGWTERSAADLGVVAGRAPGLCGRQPVLPPGRDRQRGLSRHRAPARLGAPPCAAGRLFPARGLQRARLRALRRRRAERGAAERHAAADARARICRPWSTPGSRELRDAIAAGAQVFETAHDAMLDERLNRAVASTPGATAAAACRAAPRARRCAATSTRCTSATC